MKNDNSTCIIDIPKIINVVNSKFVLEIIVPNNIGNIILIVAAIVSFFTVNFVLFLLFILFITNKLYGNQYIAVDNPEKIAINNKCFI